MIRRLFLAAALVLPFVMTSEASAGDAWPRALSIGANTSGNYYVSGSLWKVRSSADSNSYIGCHIRGDYAVGYIRCEASDAAGNYRGCIAYPGDPGFDQMALAVTSVNWNSYVYFKTKTDGYTCDILTVDNNSRFAE